LGVMGDCCGAGGMAGSGVFGWATMISRTSEVRRPRGWTGRVSGELCRRIGWLDAKAKMCYTLR